MNTPTPSGRTAPALSVLVLPDLDPPQRFVREVADAERAGIATVWTYDHLNWGGLAPTQPWYSCIPMLTAAAMATSTVRLGTQVATPNYRHPVVFANEVMTLDRLSGGRLDLGVGTGVADGDALTLGDPPRGSGERLRRFAEWLSLLDELLTRPRTDHAGEFFSAVDAHLAPGCLQTPRVPFTVAAVGPKAMRLAARYGQGWISYGAYPYDVPAPEWFAEIDRQNRVLTEAVEAEGRDPAAVRRIAQLAVGLQWPFESAQRYEDFCGRLVASGFDEISLHWPRSDGRGIPRDALDLVLGTHFG